MRIWKEDKEIHNKNPILQSKENKENILGIQKQSHEDRIKKLEDIYEIYFNKILNYFYYQTGNKEVAEELSQEVFLKAFKAIPTYRGEASLKTWIYTIAHNLYVSWYKKDRKYNMVPIDKSLLNSLKSNEGQPEKSIENKEKIELVNEILYSLKEEYRDVLILCDFQGLTYSEIADTLSWTLAKVKITLYRARIQFKSNYEKKYNGK